MFQPQGTQLRVAPAYVGDVIIRTPLPSPSPRHNDELLVTIQYSLLAMSWSVTYVLFSMCSVQPHAPALPAHDRALFSVPVRSQTHATLGVQLIFLRLLMSRALLRSTMPLGPQHTGEHRQSKGLQRAHPAVVPSVSLRSTTPSSTAKTMPIFCPICQSLARNMTAQGLTASPRRCWRYLPLSSAESADFTLILPSPGVGQGRLVPRPGSSAVWSGLHFTSFVFFVSRTQAT